MSWNTSSWLAILTILAVTPNTDYSLISQAKAAEYVDSRASSSYTPIFSMPPEVNPNLAFFLLARDPAILSNMDFSSQTASARSTEIQQMISDFKMQQKGSIQAKQLGETIIKLHEEQALYYENLSAFGLKDPKQKDLEHAIKMTRSAQVSYIDQLLNSFPKAAEASKWKAKALLSRIKIGDPSSVQESLLYIKKFKTGDATRLKIIGTCLDYIKGVKASPFGTPSDLLKLPMDSITKAGLQLFVAESVASTSPQKAIALYLDASRGSIDTKSKDGKANVITSRSVAKVVTLTIKSRPNSVDNDTVGFLQSLGFTNIACYYLEKIALNSVNNNPSQAMKYYTDIIQLSSQTPTTVLNIEHRILDIAINSQNHEAIESQWVRIAKMANGLVVPGAEARINATQNLNWKTLDKDLNNKNVSRFIRMHDLFMPVSISYKNTDSWSIKVLEALFRTKQNADLAIRADQIAEDGSKPSTKISALRYAARARENILGINIKPEFKKNRKLNGGAEVAKAYIQTLQKLEPLIKGEEAENCSYQSANIVYASGNSNDYRANFETALNKYPKSTFAGPAVSFLLELSATGKDFIYTEKIARLAEAKHIKPSNGAHKNLRDIIEAAVYEQATNLANQQQFDEAAQKYIAFQKEFPKSKKADVALNLAAKNYLSSKKTELALEQMEALLKSYPKSTLAKETRWNAAEQARSIGQFLRAANHYESYDKEWKNDGMAKQALYKAADMHKNISRYANAISDLEKYLTQIKEKSEKVKIAKDIAELHVKYGKSGDAIGGLERVIKLSGNTEDEIWARSYMIEIYQRQSQINLLKSTVNTLLNLKPQTQEGFKSLAKAKFSMGRIEAGETHSYNPMSQKNLTNAIDTLIKKYDKIKKLLIAPCEVPGLEWCSVGYYEISRLAEDINKIILEVETPTTINPSEAEKIKKTVLENSQKLTEESKSFAAQAEEALSIGVPDTEWAARIKSWAQTQRGEGEVAPIIGE